ncbi:MAG: hypothetical protein HDR88_15050 [Bacteroides sp.]|nr:hypothetical protein [Bacteroides sp.]
MAQSLITLLSQIGDKITELEAIQQQLYSRIKVLEEENEDLRDQLKEKQQLLKQANIDKEFLTMSHRLADSPDSIISTRRRIARLIRTIDNCISMLKEE